SAPSTSRSFSSKASVVERPRLPSLLFDSLENGEENDLVVGRTHDCVAFTDIDLARERLVDRDLIECLITNAKLDDTDLQGSRMRETRLEGCEATAIKMSRTELREVEFVGCRFGALEMYDARARMLHLRDCRLGYVNLRGAELIDVTFTNCTIADLDLGGARVERLALPGCRVDSLILGDGSLKDVDLRGSEFQEITGIEALSGVTISPDQLHDLAPLLASHLGIDIA
ncbi:MAG TPA: pentapeptide repeat-containing protein, partial [Marmoricola sp.]|nr:pentapeptide repeat-containing protein [Marmoricola sp.]